MKADNTSKSRINKLYEDQYCVAIDKPAGLLVHPLLGHGVEGTLVQWWLSQKDVAQTGWIEPNRAGIVHRLDKDTSGVMLLAKSPESLAQLQLQFHERTVEKYYLAICYGKPTNDAGEVTSVISRNQTNKTKRTSNLINFDNSEAKEAVSRYNVVSTFKHKQGILSLIQWQILTGRTHQIRLHAKMIDCPILGDPDYNIKPSRRLSKEMNIARQMLHCKELIFHSIEDGKRIDVAAEIPNDMNTIINQFNEYAQ